MKKILGKIIAISLCFVFVFSITGCHEKNEKALEIGGTEYTSAFYMCALIHADLEGQQLVYNTLGQEALNDYLNQTLEGVPYRTWVKNRAIAVCKEFAAYKMKCDELLLPCDEYQSALVAQADQNWADGDSILFQANGVGRGTYRWYNSMAAYKEGYFDYLYGEDGPKAVSAEELTKNITENYVIANIISRDAETKEAADVIVKDFEGYVTRIKNGEKFEKIYQESAGIKVEEDEKTEDATEDKGTFSYTEGLADIIGSDKTELNNSYYDDLKAMANGELKVVTKTNKGTDGKEDTYTVVLFYKGDILNENNPYAKDVDSLVRHSLKDDEYQKEMNAFMQTLTVNENTKATKRFKIEKIEYPY